MIPLEQDRLEQGGAGQPFESDVCSSWMEVLPSIEINEEALERLKLGAREQKVVLLGAPRAGFGKTHLISRWVKEESQDKVFIALPWEDSDGLQWLATANGLLRNLNRPKYASENLQSIAAGILTSLLSRAIQGGKVPCANPEVAVRLITQDPVSIFKSEGEIQAISQWFRRNFPQLVGVLAQESGLDSKDKVEIWLKRLFDYAQQPNVDTSSRLATLFLEDQPKQLVSFLKLLTIYKPVVLVADHMDALFGSNSAGVAVASFSVSLASVPHVEVILCMNRDLWEVTFQHQLPSALRDRLDANPIYLQGVTKDEAIQLVQQRLHFAEVDRETTRSFLNSLPWESWIAKSSDGTLSVRNVLRYAAQAWSNRNTVSSNDEVFPATVPEVRFLEGQEDQVAKLQQSLQLNASEESVILTNPYSATFQETRLETSEPESFLIEEGEFLLPEQTQEKAVSLPEERKPSAEEASHSERADEPLASNEIKPGTSLNHLRDMLSRLNRREGKSAAADSRPKNLLASTQAKSRQNATRAAYENLRNSSMTSSASGSDLLAKMLQFSISGANSLAYHEIESPSMGAFKLPSWLGQNSEIYFGLESAQQKDYWKSVVTYLLGRSAELRLNQQRESSGAVNLRLVKFCTPEDPSSDQNFFQELGGFLGMPNHSLYKFHTVEIETETWAKMQALNELYQQIQASPQFYQPKDWADLVEEELKSFRDQVLLEGNTVC